MNNNNMNNTKKTKYAIIGTGNGGQTMAGYLALLGFEVKIYGSSQININIINTQKNIELSDYINGTGKITFASTNIQEVIKEAN